MASGVRCSRTSPCPASSTSTSSIWVCPLFYTHSHSASTRADGPSTDTIDISNLNRQFLFRESDVSLPKATVAANFVMARVGGGNSNSNSTGTGNGTGRTLTITPHQCRIQDLDPDFYRQFAIIMCGLDNMEARRWINSLVVGLVEPDDWTTIKPLIDGGTEGVSLS